MKEQIGSLSDYLQQHGITSESSRDLIEATKREYWRLYQKHYYQERKKGEKRLNVRMKADEYRLFSSFKERHHYKSMAAFIKACALKYVKKNYLPRNKEAIEQLDQGLRKVGRNINQIVQSIHRTAKRSNLAGGYKETKTIEHLETKYEQLVQQVEQMRKATVQHFQSDPTNLWEGLAEYLADHPERIQTIRSFLDEIEQSHGHKKHR